MHTKKYSNINKHRQTSTCHIYIESSSRIKTFGKLVGCVGTKFEFFGLSTLVLCTPNVGDKSRRSVESCSASATRLGTKSKTGKGKSKRSYTVIYTRLPLKDSCFIFFYPTADISCLKQSNAKGTLPHPQPTNVAALLWIWSSSSRNRF